jgi:hypothetical protein
VNNNNHIDSEAFKKDFEVQIKKSLDYLIAEGFVKKEKNLYSLKTKKESDSEIEDIDNNNG